MDILTEGKKVFATEINALEKTEKVLDHVFENIVEEILKCTGKVILSGMGKPGHVAQKLAATFASLGIPSFFLHPAEAMHGDLGMIDEKDVVMLISYSGESDEIIRILPSIKMLGAFLIGITGNENSTLAKNCDIVQVFPQFDEACHLGLAPTSSTTVAMCYGDALAVATSIAKGFTESDFGKRHPAGSLGKKLILRVEDLMAKGDEIPCVVEGTSLIETIEVISSKGLGCVAVTDEQNRLAGFFTDGDLRRIIKMYLDIYNVSIDSVMIQTPKCIDRDILVLEALRYMKDNRINSLPVIGNDKAVLGIITWQMIIRAGIVL